MSAEEIKKCPFCGSNDIEVIWDDGYEVGCKTCSTYVAPFLGKDADDKQKVIDFWNRRTTISLETAQKLADALKPYAQYQFATKDGDSFFARLPIHTNRELIQKRVDEYNSNSGASNLPDALVLEVNDAAKALAKFEREKGVR